MKYTNITAYFFKYTNINAILNKDCFRHIIKMFGKTCNKDYLYTLTIKKNIYENRYSNDYNLL